MVRMGLQLNRRNVFCFFLHPEQVGQAVMSMCEEEETVEILRKAPSPGVDFYTDDGAGLRIATYQGYLNGKTPEED